MAVNLNKYKSEIVAAWKDVIDEKTSTNWAIFGYEGLSDVLKVVCKGNDGVDEMKEELNSGQIMYAFCKILDPKTSLKKYVLINWQGEGVPLLRKGVCANHVRDVSNVLKGAHVTVNARTEEDVDSDIIIDKVSKSTASMYSFEERLDLSKEGFQKLNSAYKKVEPSKEINPTERDKFWALEEEQEKQRQLEEARRRQEELIRLEEERIKRETEDAKKREEMTAKEEPVTIPKASEIKKETNISISSKIRQIEQSVNSAEALKEMRKKETEELISRRTADVRAVFERNTSAGQILNTGRKTSAQSNGVNKSNGCVASEPTANGIAENYAQPVKKIESEPKEESEVISPEESNLSNYSSTNEAQETLEVYENGPVDVGLKAQALYDYQAADDTEISFDPDDIITHIEQIDPGWWQGLGPDGNYGLFPANYVQLIP
ncbi:hypothetical protein V9T40_012520 [Parthenolecanium corni]|uniref:Drebrin-like protein n=1 Tax=Parthenolecanium corni TaxID=536013 RepID=A0AAN9T8U5_9HEMI